MTVRWVVITCAFPLAAGCASPPVDVAFGGSDTVVVNAVDPALITLEARDAAGNEAALKKARFTYVSGDRLPLSEDGVVECTERGEMQFEVAVRGFSKRMTLLCRPIRGFAVPGEVRLVAGGAEEDLPINPLAREGGLEEEFRAKVTLVDTNVVTIQKGKVFPRHTGETYVDAQVGDCVLRIRVAVMGRAQKVEEILPFEAFASDVVLSDSTPATWSIPAGRYRFYPRGPARISGTGLNCVAIAGGASCVTKPGATLTLSRERPGRGADTVRLEVHRLSDDPTGVRGGARHVSGRSRDNDRCVNYLGGFASR